MEFLDYAAVTHAGTVKSINEDSVFAQTPVFVVADGISGNGNGELASQLVVEKFAELVHGPRPLGPDVVPATLDALHQAALDAQRRDNHDSATTACGAVAVQVHEQAYWVIFNIGDSRVYRMTRNDGQFAQVSVDHSHVQELLEAGIITQEQAARHPERHVITRAVGAEGNFRPDYWLVPMILGDRLLICSDGLLREASLDDVRALVLSDLKPAEAVDRLLQLALAAGAKDNVSIIVVDVREPTGEPGEVAPTIAEGVTRTQTSSRVANP